MSFWAGFAGSVADDIGKREQAERDEATAGKERDSKIAIHLLESQDPDVQMAGMSMLQQAASPLKRKKGLGGFVGKYEQSTDPLRPFLDLANKHARPQDRSPDQAQIHTNDLAPPPDNQPDPGQFSAPPGAGAAALPASSPVTGGAITPPAPSAPAPRSSPMALARGQVAPAFGEDNTAAGMAGMADPSAMGMPPQGSPQGSPMAAAVQPAQAPPYINPHVVAAKVSEDRGTLEPGKVTGMFWPTAAQLSANKVKGDLFAQAEVLQKLGASPADVLDTMTARMGNNTAAMSATNAGTVKLPSGESVQTFIQRDPRSNTVQRVYSAGGVMVPVPAGSQDIKLPGAAGAGSGLTSHMTTEQALAEGIIEQGDYPPGAYLKVKVLPNGSSQVQADIRPPNPFPQTGAPTGTMVMDRNGNMVPNPAAPQPHPQVIAAKALAAAVSKDFNVVNGIPNALQQAFLKLRIGYPSLNGLTPQQIQQLAQLEDTATPQQVQAIMGAGAPLSVAPPPGGAGASGGAAANGGLPPDWATKMAIELEKQRAARPRQ